MCVDNSMFNPTPPTTVTTVTVFEYDEEGAVTTVTVFEYDEKGRVTKKTVTETHTTPGGSNPWTPTYPIVTY